MLLERQQSCEHYVTSNEVVSSSQSVIPRRCSKCMEECGG